MILTNSGYRYGSLGIGLGFPISNRLFLPNGTDNPAYDNADFYPNSANGNSSNFILMNSKSSDLGEDPAGGGYYDGWVVGQNNRAIATTIINAFPRRMMQNLLLVPGKDNIPIPIAGSYFTKLMDHTPGTLEPWSTLITDGDGYIDEIRCHTLTVDGGGPGFLDGVPENDIALLGSSGAVKGTQSFQSPILIEQKLTVNAFSVNSVEQPATIHSESIDASIFDLNVETITLGGSALSIDIGNDSTGNDTTTTIYGDLVVTGNSYLGVIDISLIDGGNF